jgi:hypothetical protein
MSFDSTNRIPYLRDYAEAKHLHDRVKPIRGSEPPLKPLAARRDKQMAIRENAEGHIECVLYETPVVTFRQDGVVTVTPGKWPSAYTSSFIENVLPGVSVNRTRDILIVRVGGSKYPLKQGMKLNIQKSSAPTHTWEAVEAEGVKAWSPNRAKANNVRSAYKGMLAYHKNIVALLSQEADKEDNHYGLCDPDEPFVTKKVIVLNMEALKIALGTKKIAEQTFSVAKGSNGLSITHTDVEVLDTDMFSRIVHKPTWSGNQAERVTKWMNHRDELLALMRDDQPEETKHANFMKVSMGLLVNRTGYLPLHPRHNMRSEFRLARSTALEVVNDFLTLAHAEDMMEYKQLPVGRVPTTNYAGMLFDNFRNEGEKA